MLTMLVKTRKFNKEVYEVYLHQPEFEGELGCLGIEIDSHVSVKTPKNDFGYSDIVLFDKYGNGYTSHRYLQPWIIRELEKINKTIMDSINA